jgi:IS5 family transposase
VKLADALDDRASFRRFCGFSRVQLVVGVGAEGE